MTSLLGLAAVYLLLSLVSVGGPGAMVSTAQRQLVVNLQWLTAAQFSSIYGLAAAAPGPNIIFFVGLAYVLEGWPGVAVAVLCFVIPLGVMAALVDWAGDRFHRPWVARLRRGLHPVVIGLGVFGAYVAAEGLDQRGLALAAVGTVVLIRTKVNPALVVGALAIVGAFVLGGS